MRHVAAVLLMGALAAGCAQVVKENPVAQVKRDAGRVWVEGVPELRWGADRECTYAGALAAALSVTAHPVSYDDIMGLSGLAFRVRWWLSPTEPGERGWCPSTPVGEFPEEVAATQKRTGWLLFTEARMDRQKDPHMEDVAPMIRAAIETGWPVAAYPTPENLDVGVIYGYQDGGRTWLLRDYFAKDGTTLVAMEKLGPMILIPREFRPAMPRRQALIECLKMGVANWSRGKGPGRKGPYLYGKPALEQWGRDIALADDPAARLSPTERQGLYFLDWWNFSQWADARGAAARFLVRAGEEFGGQVQAVLKRAAERYGQEASLLGSCFRNKDAFLGPWAAKKIDDWTPEVRKREREVLAEAIRLEAAAMAEVEAALREFRPQSN
jgi:hypothetical protein